MTTQNEVAPARLAVCERCNRIWNSSAELHGIDLLPESPEEEFTPRLCLSCLKDLYRQSQG